MCPWPRQHRSAWDPGSRHGATDLDLHVLQSAVTVAQDPWSSSRALVHLWLGLADMRNAWISIES